MNRIITAEMTEGVRNMVADWLADRHGDREAVAQYMSQTLRIGGIRICRALVDAALEPRDS